MDVLLHTLLHRQRLASAIPHASPPPSYEPCLATSRTLQTLRQSAGSLLLDDDPAEAPRAELRSYVAPPTAPRTAVGLGSFAPLPALLLFAPSVAASLQRAYGFDRKVAGSAPHVDPATSVDHTDVWDDEFVSETALDRALPAGVTPAGPKDVFHGVANFNPQLTENGMRHASGLTPDAQLGYTPLDEAIVRAVERGKSTEVRGPLPRSSSRRCASAW